MADLCDIGFKQKAAIEFLSFQDNVAKKICERLKNVYGGSALLYASEKRWVTHFKSGSSSITDRPRSGRPTTVVTEETRVLVDGLIRIDRRITVREIVEKIGTGHNAAHNIICAIPFTLFQDTAIPSTPLQQSQQCLLQRGWTVLPHPADSPDLPPTDFHIFGYLKDYLRGQKFEDDDAVQYRQRHGRASDRAHQTSSRNAYL